MPAESVLSTRARRVLAACAGSFAGLAVLLLGHAAHAQSMTLREGAVNALVNVEIDMSSGAAGEIVSIAPDVSFGATPDLTLSVIHSVIGRTGFRGAAGAGLCVTDTCAHTYDNVGLEATYSLARGPFALAANGGVHAWALDAGFYVVKVGAKARYTVDRLSVTMLPSVTIAVTERDAMPANRDRLWLPFLFMYGVGGGLSLGVGTGFKAAFDDIGNTYEVAVGGVAQYVVSPALTLGGSWIHGKMLGGDAVIPAGESGVDFRALHLWVSTTL